MACDYQAILDEASCFAALPSQVLDVIQAQLLCQISEASGGGGSPDSPNATVAEPFAAATTVDGNGKTIAEILTGNATTYLIRYALVTADTANAVGDDIALRKGSLGVIFTPPISAGGVWRIDAPDGTFFDANLIRVVAIAHTPQVIVFAMR